jgi:hypothetical protein
MITPYFGVSRTTRWVPSLASMPPSYLTRARSRSRRRRVLEPTRYLRLKIALLALLGVGAACLVVLALTA